MGRGGRVRVGGGGGGKREKEEKRRRKKPERKTGVWQNYDESYCWSTLCTLVCVLFVLVSVWEDTDGLIINTVLI